MNPILPDHILEKMDPKDRKRLGKAGTTLREALEKHETEAERAIQKQISNYLRLHGIAFYQPAMHRRTTGKPGWPDFTFSINGKACAMEAKTATGTLSDDQKVTIPEMRSNGWNVEIVRSLEEAKAFLERMGMK